jgi:hypothetical protein
LPGESGGQDRRARGPKTADASGGLASFQYRAPAEDRTHGPSRAVGVGSGDRVRAALPVRTNKKGGAGRSLERSLT